MTTSPRRAFFWPILQEDFTVSIAQFKSLAAEYSDRPEGEEAQKNLGARYYLADKYPMPPRVIRISWTIIRKAPHVPRPDIGYASSLSGHGPEDKAAEQYKKGPEDSPDSPWAPKALMGMGNAYFKMKKYDDAQKQYLKILDQYHFYDELNLVYFKLGQIYEAEQIPKKPTRPTRPCWSNIPSPSRWPRPKTRMADLEAAFGSSQDVAGLPEPTATPVPAQTPAHPGPPFLPPPRLRQGFGGQAQNPK